jgi:hypothetical protein
MKGGAMQFKSSSLTFALAAVLSLSSLPVRAASPSPQIISAASSQTNVQRVRYRRHHGSRHHHHHNYDRDVAIGLGLGLLGGIVSDAARTDYYNYYDPRSLCATRFRSFEWDTGLYTTYEGDKRLCPYLE